MVTKDDFESSLRDCRGGRKFDGVFSHSATNDHLTLNAISRGEKD